MYIRMIREIVLKSSVVAGHSCSRCSNKRNHLVLLSSKLEVTTPEVYTEQGVPVMADGTAIIKIGGSISEIATAAEQFLGKSKADRENEAKEVLEGHLRSILRFDDSRRNL